MFKKILYGVGGIFALLVFLVIIIPVPDQPSTPVSGKAAQTETAEDAQASMETAVSEEQLAPMSSSQAQPNEGKTVPQTADEPAVPSEPQFQYYSVASVVDGDTIKLNINGAVETLRLIGIDTPETVDPRKPVQCFGEEASSRAKELLSGKKVRIESDPTQDTRDKYGRLLAYVYREDGLFFNKRMIADGYAYEYTYDTPYKYQTEFKGAQQLAQSGEKGLWSPDTCNGQRESSPTQAPAATPSNGAYYTSSHYSAKYYYPESCDGWESLSEKYLKSFNTLEELLSEYDRVLSPQCE